jgi:xanthine dehydrogenase accessory factor
MSAVPPVAVRVEVAQARGSTPREAGAAMLVDAETVQGSIGGGRLEFAAVIRARGLLAGWRAAPETAAAEEAEFALGPALGQCCGGAVRLRYLPAASALATPPPPLLSLQLHGAGHVGRALIAVLRTLPVAVHWLDARPEQFPPPASAAPGFGLRCDHRTRPAAAVAEAPPGSAFLVMTHSHALDWEIMGAVLRRGDAGFAGLIGSASKRARFLHRWRAAGIGEAALARLTCPIGLPGIAGKQPEVIALAVAAQLLHGPAAAAARQDPATAAAACAGCADATCRVV